jgi:hypothetical protein
MGSPVLRVAIISLAALVTFLPRPGRAVDPFEIEVYDGTANQPGMPGVELHANSVASGLHTSVGPELPANHQSHFTLEPSLGLLSWWEIGGYLQTALRADGAFDYAGTKLRSKFVTPPSFSDRVRFGANLEVSLLPQHYDRNRWGMELRPIAAYEDEHWLLAFNPIVDLALAGPDYHRGPWFQPAAMAVFKLIQFASVGVEYYGNLGPFSGFASGREQEHYIYEVFNLLAVSHIELNAGIGEGLTAGSNPLTIKMIVGYSWERSESHLPSVGFRGRDAPMQLQSRGCDGVDYAR